MESWRMRMLTTLPYGQWTTADGQEVLFNKDFKGIWRRRPGQPAVPAKGRPDKIVTERFFYDRDRLPWKDSGAMRRCRSVLDDWGVPPPCR